MIAAAPPILLGIGMILLVGCGGTNHYLAHPREPAPELILWSADFARDELEVHIEGARPPGDGRFPTVLVLPEEEKTALDMHGVIWDLAAHRYVAIAAHYRSGCRRPHLARIGEASRPSSPDCPAR